MVDALWLMGRLNYPKLDGTAVPYFEESIELARAIDYVQGRYARLLLLRRLQNRRW